MKNKVLHEAHILQCETSCETKDMKIRPCLARAVSTLDSTRLLQ